MVLPNQEDQNTLALLFFRKVPYLSLQQQLGYLLLHYWQHRLCLEQAPGTPAPLGRRHLSCPLPLRGLEKGTWGSSGRRYTSCHGEARALLVTGTGPAEENTSCGAVAFSWWPSPGFSAGITPNSPRVILQLGPLIFCE